MKFSHFLAVLGIVSTMSWLAWLTVVLYINPQTSGAIGLAVFYLALMIALVSSFTLLGLGVRLVLARLRQHSSMAFQYITPAIRQAVWFTVSVVVSLALLANQLFTWWSAMVLVLGLVAVEALYLTKQAA
ncbi:MAG: hypothetical protein HYV33_01630 [Candidatus Kerfeldbacteria bacterium]|nr:hypothetical protein [Candidatus Kerfeldbacteria bacterium]